MTSHTDDITIAFSGALASMRAPRETNTSDETDYCYRLIHRVYLDLKEASRLQTLLAVQDAIGRDFEKANYIKGTVHSAESAVTALILQVNKLAVSTYRSSNPLSYLRQALHQRDLVLTPQIQTELHICHIALLQSIARMQGWADQADKEAVTDTRTALVPGDSAFGDIEEMLRSPYARRRERQKHLMALAHEEGDKHLGGSRPDQSNAQTGNGLSAVYARSYGGLVSQISLLSVAQTTDEHQSSSWQSHNELDSLSEAALPIPPSKGPAADGTGVQSEQRSDTSRSDSDGTICTPSSNHPDLLPSTSESRSPVSTLSRLAPSALSMQQHPRRASQSSQHRIKAMTDDAPMSCAESAISSLIVDQQHSCRPGAYGAVELDSNPSPKPTSSSLPRADPITGRKGHIHSPSYDRSNWTDAPIVLEDSLTANKARALCTPPDENLPEVCLPSTDHSAHIKKQELQERFPDHKQRSGEMPLIASLSSQAPNKDLRRARKARRALLESG